MKNLSRPKFLGKRMGIALSIAVISAGLIVSFQNFSSLTDYGSVEETQTIERLLIITEAFESYLHRKPTYEEYSTWNSRLLSNAAVPDDLAASLEQQSSVLPYQNVNVVTPSPAVSQPRTGAFKRDTFNPEE